MSKNQDKEYSEAQHIDEYNKSIVSLYQQIKQYLEDVLDLKIKFTKTYVSFKADKYFGLAEKPVMQSIVDLFFRKREGDIKFRLKMQHSDLIDPKGLFHVADGGETEIWLTDDSNLEYVWSLVRAHLQHLKSVAQTNKTISNKKKVKRQEVLSEADFIWRDQCLSVNPAEKKKNFGSWSIPKAFHDQYEDGTDRLFAISFPNGEAYESFSLWLHITSGREITFPKEFADLCQLAAKQMGHNFSIVFKAEDITDTNNMVDIEYAPKMVLATVKRRTQQYKYRDELMQLWGSKCALTGIDFPKLLIASHIKPFIVCNDNEAYDACNGLPLTAHVDKLFDQGFISFNQDGLMMMANAEVEELVGTLGLSGFLGLRFDDLQNHKAKEAILGYLKYHRQHVFQKG